MNLRVFVSIFLSFLSFNVPAHAFLNFGKNKQKITIATGSPLGGYYNIGLKLCKFVESSNDNVACKAIVTSGSVENLRLLARGEVDYAIAQSNLASSAYHGSGFFYGKDPAPNLMQVLALHDEAFTIIVRDNDKIRYFNDLEGRKITNGSVASASSITYDELLEVYALENRPKDVELDTEDYAKRLCAGDVDAIIMMVGHPNSLVSHITGKCEVDFAGVDRDEIERMKALNPAYHEVILKKSSVYSGITEDQVSFGVTAALLTHSEVDANITKNFLNYFSKNVKSFVNAHPALEKVRAEDFFSNFILPRFR